MNIFSIFKKPKPADTLLESSQNPQRIDCKPVAMPGIRVSRHDLSALRGINAVSGTDALRTECKPVPVAGMSVSDFDLQAIKEGQSASLRPSDILKRLDKAAVPSQLPEDAPVIRPVKTPHQAQMREVAQAEAAVMRARQALRDGSLRRVKAHPTYVKPTTDKDSVSMGLRRAAYDNAMLALANTIESVAGCGVDETGRDRNQLNLTTPLTRDAITAMVTAWERALEKNTVQARR